MTDWQPLGGQQPDPNELAAYAAQGARSAAPIARGMVAPTPTGPTGLMGYAAEPVAGFYQAGSNLGSAVQAGAKLIGADDVANSAAAFAARQRATAATYQNPDIDKYAWYDPRKIASQVLSGAPVLAGGALAGAAGFLAGGPPGAAVAAGAFGYPFAVGSNVEAQEAYNGPLSTHDAAKAALLGVPEAAIGAYPLARVGGMVAQGVKGSILHEVTSQAAAQAAASAGQDFIAQQMGDPNRPIASRMSEMMQSILTGGVTGALMGAGVHALAPSAKTPPPDLGNKPMADMVDAALNPGQRLLPPPSPVDQLGKPLQITDQSNNRLASGEVVPYFEQRPLGEEPAHTAPDVVAGASPADIPVRPFQHLEDDEVRSKARFLWDHGARPGDPELDALREEWQIRTMVGDQSAQRALPPPERVPTASPDLESDRAHEPTTATVTTGFDAKGNPTLAPAPIELGQTHVGEPVAAPAPLALEARAQGLGSQEPIPAPAPPHPLTDAPPDKLRAAAKTAAKTAPTWLDTSSFEAAQKSIQAKLSPAADDPPVRASTLTLAHKLADVFGVKDGVPEAPVSPAVAPLEALHADPEVQASPTLAAKVGAALDTAKTPTPSPAAIDIGMVAKLRAAKPAIVTYEGKQYSGATKLDAVKAAQRDAVKAAQRDPASAPPRVTDISQIWDASQDVGAKTPTQTSLDALKKMTDVAAPGLSKKAATIINNGWQAELAKDPSGQSAWDKFAADDRPKLNPVAQAALEAHGNVVEDAKAKALPGPRSAQPQTQFGVDVEHIIDSGGLLAQALLTSSAVALTVFRRRSRTGCCKTAWMRRCASPMTSCRPMQAHNIIL